MSMTTHRFQSYQTLARAQAWLDKVGIPPDRIEVSSTGMPSMTVQTDFGRLPEVEMIINAAELTDPEGWPSLDHFGDLRLLQLEVKPAPIDAEQLHTTPIGWHPTD